MSHKFEKIELITSMETYCEDPSESTVSALDLILEFINESPELELNVVEFKQPKELKLVEIEESK